jgi:23S rRNA (pseudouridine1915-N3)-methyltransferase
MKLELVAFGKLRSPGLREATDYYLKMTRPWLEIHETELKPLSVPDKSPETRARIQARENEALERAISPKLATRGALYLLDETGRSLATRDWAQLFRSWEETSVPTVALVIGGSLGFGSELRKKARGVLSLGPQTLSHELARVVLCEQIFRALSVLRGHPYHNEG